MPATGAVHQLDRAEARRIAIRAQLLDAGRPSDLLDVVPRLTFLQLDPTAAVAPSADLVAWARLGDGYRPDDLVRAVYVDRTLYEFDALVRPMTDLPLYLGDMAAWPRRETTRAWLTANDRFRRDVLDRLGTAGPLLSRDIPDTHQVPWASTGWTGDRNVTQMLEFLVLKGEVAIAGRQGRQRLWDLAERVYPADLAPVPVEEARRLRDERRLQALGIARATGTALPVEPATVGDTGEPAVVEGVRGEWRVDPAQLGRTFEGRTALLSPFDRLVHDRTRAQELFDFEYVLEMYKPAARRRWGYFALPVLHHDRLVGKVDAKADRKAGTFTINAVHPDVRFTKAITKAVDAELDALATWLGLTLVRA
jgi:uncharacterized protein YcaQ